MKLIIAGSRTMNDVQLLYDNADGFLDRVTSVVSGCAYGADKLGENWAAEHNLFIHKFPANWSKYGRAAGPVRNRQMAEYADELLAFLGPGSKGTASMIAEMERVGKPITVVLI